MLASFDRTSLLTHPFFIVTTLFANASWMIALISQGLAATKYGRSTVATLWLAILLQFLVNVGVLYGLYTNLIHMFRLQISLFASMAVVLGALGINNNIFSGFRSRDAIAAAWIILSIVDLLWILVFSSERDSPVLQVFEKEARIRLSLDSNFPIDREEESQTHSPIPKDPISESKLALDPRTTRFSAPETFKSDDAARPALLQPSPIVYEGSRTSFDRPGSVLMNDRQSTTSRLTVPASIATHESSNAASSNYSYSQKALALYNYNAINSSTEVDNSGEGELSFVKGDILEVSRTLEKKWWPARRSNGQVGVVPSNYLQVIQE
ncbi:hypothetical protein EV359DRAFT_81621 [Lentinula novae-zelandiae]|nr:hypothetical protein EV359DRAFT_81621 [Lentinula novae-zelandiae]